MVFAALSTYYKPQKRPIPLGKEIFRFVYLFIKQLRIMGWRLAVIMSSEAGDWEIEWILVGIKEQEGTLKVLLRDKE